MLPPGRPLVDEQELRRELCGEANRRGLACVESRERREHDRLTWSAVNDANPARFSQRIDPGRRPAAFDEFVVDRTRHQDLGVQIPDEVEAPDACQDEQGSRVGDDDHESDASSARKSVGS